MSVIAGTTIGSNFASINCLDVLRRLFGTINIPTEVYAEIRVGREEGDQFLTHVNLALHPFVGTGWMHVARMAHDAELSLFGALPPHLHRGRQPASRSLSRRLAAAHGRLGSAARGRAPRDPASGMTGILVLAVERDVCSLEQGNAWLAELIGRAIGRRCRICPDC